MTQNKYNCYKSALISRQTAYLFDIQHIFDSNEQLSNSKSYFCK